RDEYRTEAADARRRDEHEVEHEAHRADDDRHGGPSQARGGQHPHGSRDHDEVAGDAERLDLIDGDVQHRVGGVEHRGRDEQDAEQGLHAGQRFGTRPRPKMSQSSEPRMLSTNATTIQTNLPNAPWFGLLTIETTVTMKT